MSPISLALKAPISSTDRALLTLGLPYLDRAVRQLCQTDFLVFQMVELGMEIGDHHKLWATDLATGSNVCELAPRDHGKSMSLARAYPIWRLKYDPWVQYAIVLGADRDSAVENLDKIKEMIISKPTLNYLLPESRAKGSFFSRTEIKLTNGKVIRAKAIGSMLRGRHPQLILGDDIANEKNSGTMEARKELRTYMNEVVVPMLDKGMVAKRFQAHRSQIVLVGTAQDREDIYHTVLESGEFVGRKLSAVLDVEKKRVLWPARHTYADLMAIKKTVGSLAFSKEYLNEPLSDETSIFPPALFEPLKDKQLSYVNLYQGTNPVYLGVDFSVPGSVDGDWMVVFVMEFDPITQLFTPLNYWRARPETINEQLQQIELYCSRFGVTLGYLEDNLFQRVYSEHFKRKSSLPLSGHTVTHTGKNSLEYGLLSFRPLFENGRFRFPYKTEADQAKTDLIILEFTGIQKKHGRIGNEQFHDDITMSMWHALSASRAGTSFSASWD